MVDVKEPNILSIGALLCDCGLLQRSDLKQITAAAAHQGSTVGQYLARNNLAGPQILRSAIVCQLMLRRKWLTYALAIDALTMVLEERIPFEAALAKLKWNRNYFERIFQLSELLQKSGICAEQQLWQAKEDCLQNGQPFLEVLTQRQVITEEVAELVSKCSEKLLVRQIKLEQAIDELKAFANEPFVEREPYIFAPLKLGEILMAADLVNSSDLIAAIEKGRKEQTRFGSILVRDYGLNQDILHRALFVQTQINSEFISVFDGIQGLAAPPVKGGGGLR